MPQVPSHPLVLFIFPFLLPRLLVSFQHLIYRHPMIL
ncbi:hypothetical protein NC653_031976 [Populus alba x Populus x berolinensis]|uniref:Uncharacterized protein n=1 Tax=Populus alba x Populus x berolinensis TaxID=444605 RepID=A0AAD6Q3D3_9ROSI|nr:hypothetical protein NC653_031976 [Populus alba x Populus x berolinensis]